LGAGTKETIMRKIGILLAVLVLAVPILSYAKQANYPASQEALGNEVENLPWETEEKSYQLSNSNSSLQLPEGFALIRGDGSERYIYLSQGFEYPGVEAVIVNPKDLTQVIFSFYDSGYVKIDDWNNLDPNELLEVIKRNTEINNKERIKHNLPELHVKNWLVKPVLDKENDAVYWAISAKAGERNTVNAITLKLGKNGFEKFIWVGNYDKYSNSDGLLKTMLEAHKFNQGFRYADYSIGDKIATVGIASLVAISAGGKSKAGKTTLSAIGIAILVFMKKIIIVPIMLVFGGLWALIKKSFSRKTPDDKNT
jgi:uncharacterized membrane-anchored protein